MLWEAPAVRRSGGITPGARCLDGESKYAFCPRLRYARHVVARLRGGSDLCTEDGNAMQHIEGGGGTAVSSGGIADTADEFREQGRELVAAGLHAAALSSYEKAVELAPTDAESLTALGRLLDQVFISGVEVLVCGRHTATHVDF